MKIAGTDPSQFLENIASILELIMQLTSPPPGEAHMAFSMAGILTAGGVLALARKGSLVSVAPSLLFAGGSAIAGDQISRGEGVTGHSLAAGLGGILGTGMVARARVAGAMPAGVVGSLALLSAGYHGYKYAQWTGKI